jgi:F-type H+-transporting ATPase subunit b
LVLAEQENRVDLNATIVAQMIIVAIVFWVATLVWPQITDAIQQRQKRIAEGLAAAERGQKDLAAAQSRVDELVKEARVRAQQIEGAAQRQANELVETAKQTASTEGQRLLAAAQQQVTLESQKARDELRKQVASLAVAGAGKLIDKEIDAAKHTELLDKLVAQI